MGMHCVISAFYLGALWCGVGWWIGNKSLSVLPLWEDSGLWYGLVDHERRTWELILCLSGNQMYHGVVSEIRRSSLWIKHLNKGWVTWGWPVAQSPKNNFQHLITTFNINIAGADDHNPPSQDCSPHPGKKQHRSNSTQHPTTKSKMVQRQASFEVPHCTSKEQRTQRCQ